MAYIDVIVPSCNQPQMLHGMLSSFKMSTLDLNGLARVIVVNNGSPDSIRRFNQELYWTKWIQADRNLGWEGGLARGLQVSDAPIVAFANDDIWFLPRGQSWVRTLLSWFHDPQVAAVGPSSNYVMGAQSIFWTPPESVTGWPAWSVAYLIGFFVLIRRSALDAIGGLDLGLPGGDDLDWSLRFRQAGYRLIADRSEFVYHHGSVTGKAEHGTHWNSEDHLHPIHAALIRKHGFLPYWETVTGAPEPYIPPGHQVGEGGSEERLLREAMPASGQVLDVGCGNTKVIPWSTGIDHYAFQEDIAQLNRAKSRADVCHDLRQPLPVESASVDGIVAKHILEHLPDTVAVLRDWYRVLKPGARVAIAVPDERKVSSVGMNPEHCHGFTPEGLQAIAELVGFRTVDILDPQNGISFVYVGERDGHAT